MRPIDLTRRQFGTRLLTGLSVSAAAPLDRLAAMLQAAQAPGIVTAPSARMELPSGVMSGDVTADSAVIWSRADRPSTMLVQWSTTASFENVRRVVGPLALADVDHTAKTTLTGLPAGQHIFYRVRFADLADSRLISEPIEGHFKMPSAEARDISFVWTGDTAGQGFGIDLSRGGMRTYETMRVAQPDFFVHVGDTIYADAPLAAEMPLDDGTVWRNVMTPEKAKVAESLSEFRGNHLYNYLDAHVRRFNSEVPGYYQWDDHEVLNNWYPSEELQDDRYTERKLSVLASRAKRAFFQCLPVRPHPTEQIFRTIAYGPLLELFILDMRSYRGPNTANKQASPDETTAILGREQLDALKKGLAASRATWKVICSDMPIGLIVADGSAFEAVANGDAGPPLGREFEIAELLKHLRDARIRNVIWITADVHHASSIHYDPARASFKEFDPFWEFVSGPVHAGTFAPPPLDSTFGPETRYLGIPSGMKANRPPSAGLQFFGRVRIDAASRAMTVEHWNVGGERLWSIVLPAARPAQP